MTDIPSEVFDKYEEYADAMITHFGIPCKLLYVTRVAETTPAVDHPKQRRTMRPNPPAPGGFGKGNTTFKNVETEEDITLRVYWTEKEWKKIGKFDLPDGSILCIGYATDLPKLNKADQLIVNTNMEGYEDYRFEKAAEPRPWGLRQRRYVLSIWKRA